MARLVLGVAAIATAAQPVLGGTARAGGDDSSLVQALDYVDDLVTPEEMAEVPAFAPVLPLRIEQSAPLAPGEDLPTLCGGRDAGAIAGAKVGLSSLPGVDVAYTMASVESAKAYLRQSRREVQGCNRSYPSGDVTLTPVDDQPVVKFGSVEVAVLATTIEPSGNSAFQIAVRAKGVKRFVGYYIVVATPGVVTMTERDLAALAALAVGHLNELNGEFERARNVSEAEGE